MDPDDPRMIDEGLIQIEVRMEGEGGSRTIRIPMYRNLLRNTAEVVPVLGPLSSEAKCETLKKLVDSTVWKNIAGHALRVSMVIFHSFFFVLTCFQTLTFAFL